MKRVVVTGLGAITPIGNSVNDMWDSVKQARCGIDKITHFDTTGWNVTLAGEVKDFAPDQIVSRPEARKMDNFTLYAVAAATEAMEDCGLDISKEDAERCGVIFSSGIGGLGTIQRECLRGESKGYERLSPHFIPMSISNMAAGHIAIRFGLHGMCTCVVTACAGGTNSIGDAFRQIKDGYHDVMLCGGSEASITSLGIGGFSSMKALSQSSDPNRASIPFDKERNGFVMGEGAGVLVLEEYEHAINRGAKIYCEITGYGSTCDANHVTAPLEDGSMAARCMQKAIEESGITPDQMDYINAHGTSTVLNDKSETKAVRVAFGSAADKLAISSTKSMTGHLLGASGAVEAIITTLAVKNDILPPTVNYRVSDEECDLDIVPNEMRQSTVNYAMSNSLGFGGHNASIVFKKI